MAGNFLTPVRGLTDPLPWGEGLVAIVEVVATAMSPRLFVRSFHSRWSVRMTGVMKYGWEFPHPGSRTHRPSPMGRGGFRKLAKDLFRYWNLLMTLGLTTLALQKFQNLPLTSQETRRIIPIG